MKLAQSVRIKGEGAIALLVIVLLILAGIVWWLYSARQDAEKNGRIFAGEVAQRVAVGYDEKFLHVHMSPEAQQTYLRSARDRLLDRMREFGVPAQPIAVQGDVEFTSYFFDPRGTFHAQLVYPATTAQLSIDISRGMTVWQVDAVGLTGNLPTPPPGLSPTPTPTPEPKPTRKRSG